MVENFSYEKSLMQILSESVVYESFRCRAFGNQNKVNIRMQDSGQKEICCAEIRTMKNCICRIQDIDEREKGRIILVASEISGCFSGFLFKSDVHCRT